MAGCAAPFQYRRRWMRTGSTQQTRQTAVAPAADHRLCQLCTEQAMAGLLLAQCGMYVGHGQQASVSAD